MSILTMKSIVPFADQAHMAPVQRALMDSTNMVPGEINVFSAAQAQQALAQKAHMVNMKNNYAD